ncbi:MAG: DUF2891 family protein [Bdellovibrionales bacterium]|nr:DUF2891 family protein [Bdellovibrionales bacterium]
MRSLIVAILFIFISFSLFAEEPKPRVPTEDLESFSSQFEIPASPTPPKEKSPTQMLMDLVLEEISQERWLENRAPGPVFNTCSTWMGAIQCFWAVFRMSNQRNSGEEYRKQAYAINNRFTVEGLEKELNYLQAFSDSISPYNKAWFLLLVVEFIYWNGNENLTDHNKIIPIANALFIELSSFIGHHPIGSFKGLKRAEIPFVLYSLHSYLSLLNFMARGELTDQLQSLNDLIETHFLHRNDNSQLGLKAKTQVCSLMKRAGIHRDYLEEKGLLLPGYEEFEERAALEDIKRIKACETEYETISYSGGGPGEPKDVISSFYYANVLLLLKKTGGNEAVKHFIRYNPVSQKEFALPDEMFDNTPENLHYFLVWNRRIAYLILMDLYDDPEWQMTWQSIENNIQKALLLRKMPDSLFSVFALFGFSEPVFLSHRMTYEK